MWWFYAQKAELLAEGTPFQNERDYKAFAKFHLTPSFMNLGTDVRVKSVTEDGMVVGWKIDESLAPPHKGAAIWTDQQGWQFLEDLGGESKARQATSCGSKIVGWSFDKNTKKRAVLWTRNEEGDYEIETMDPYGFGCSAKSISKNGDMVLYQTDAQYPKAICSDAAKKMTCLGNLRKGIASRAYSVSADHKIVGWVQKEDLKKKAVCWTKAGDEFKMTYLRSPASHSIALTISENGGVIGGLMQSKFTDMVAVLWTDDALWSVQGLLEEKGVLNGDRSVQLTTVTSLSSRGNIMIGEMLYKAPIDGEYSRNGYRAVLPQPSKNF